LPEEGPSANIGRVTSKTPAERALDLLVFAPLGLALSARDLLPTLVEKGRQQFTGQVTQAKVIGQFAVQQGSKEAGKAFEKARSSAESTLSARLGENGAGPAPGTVARQPAAPSRPAPTPVRPAPSRVRPTPAAAATPTPASAGPAPAPEPVRAEPAPTPGAPAPLAGTLAIPAYDSLSASQVVPRLSGLSATELEAVRDYEAAHRGRKTILNRVAQLQSA
jgi:hypothetical protein